MHPSCPSSLLPRAPRQRPLELQKRAANLIADRGMALLRVMMVSRHNDRGMRRVSGVCGVGTATAGEEASAARGRGDGVGGAATTSGEERHVECCCCCVECVCVVSWLL